MVSRQAFWQDLGSGTRKTDTVSGVRTSSERIHSGNAPQDSRFCTDLGNYHTNHAIESYENYLFLSRDILTERQLRRQWGGAAQPPSSSEHSRGTVLAPASVCGFACFSRFQRLRVTNLLRKISKKSTIDLLEVKLQYEMQNIFSATKIFENFPKFSKFLKNSDFF